MKKRLISDAILFVVASDATLFMAVAGVTILSALMPLPSPANPPPASQPVMETITQGASQFAFNCPPNAKDFRIEDTHVAGGGILVASHGAKYITLTNVISDGAVRGGGVYRVILATKSVASFEWDNSEWRKSHPDTDDCVNGGEAGIRIMGGAGDVVVRGVNFRNRKHDFYDPTGIMAGTPFVKQVFWKQVIQVRDARNCVFQDCRIIGLIDVGQQKNTALTSQLVGALTFDHCRMTSMPSITDPKTVGRIVIHDCLKIDEKSNVVGKWPDATWTAANH